MNDFIVFLDDKLNVIFKYSIQTIIVDSINVNIDNLVFNLIIIDGFNAFIICKY
jgi:hypothetical protein